MAKRAFSRNKQGLSQDNDPPVKPSVEQPFALAQRNQSFTMNGTSQTGGPQTSGIIKALHWNLGFECMSGGDFGSGQIASIHCQPGYWKGSPDDLNPDSNWEAITDKGVIEGYRDYLGDRAFTFQKDPKVAQDRLTDKYATSCTRNMIDALNAWGKDTDFVTFVELCNPGTNEASGDGWAIDTKEWGTGFQEDGAVGAVEMDGKIDRAVDRAKYDKRQCSLLTFHKISVIYPSSQYNYVINVQPGSLGPVQQLSIYKRETFGDLSAFLDLQVCGGRPVTALIFPGVMLLNIHTIHFRKTLMKPGGDPFQPGSPLLTYACNFMKRATKATKDAFGIDDWDCTLPDEAALKAIWKPNTLAMAFSQQYLPSSELQKLFGGFLESQILKGLRRKGYLDSKSFLFDLKSLDRIIAAGDFNDELHELTSFPIFGKVLKIDEAKTKRTCCSDREQTWVAEYIKTKKANALGESPIGVKKRKDRKTGAMVSIVDADVGKFESKDYTVPTGFTAHAPANQVYLQDSYGEGAQSTPVTPIKGGIERGSNYPFASDLILDTAGGPLAGLQIPGDGLSVRGTDGQWDPDIVGFPGTNSVISDHDPIFAILSGL